MAAGYEHDQPVALTCPDCGGAVRRTELGTLTQFHCHIGHVYTADVMAAAQFAALEWTLASALRSLREREELCRQMKDNARGAGDADAAARWETAAQEARERGGALQQLLEQEWTYPAEGKPAAASGK